MLGISCNLKMLLVVARPRLLQWVLASCKTGHLIKVDRLLMMLAVQGRFAISGSDGLLQLSEPSVG